MESNDFRRVKKKCTRFLNDGFYYIVVPKLICITFNIFVQVKLSPKISRVYIEHFLQLKYMPEKNSICLISAAWNRWVMMTFLLFTPVSEGWLGWRKTENPRRNRLGWFCDTYCTVILRYSLALRVISDILWSSCFESNGPKDTR